MPFPCWPSLTQLTPQDLKLLLQWVEGHFPGGLQGWCGFLWGLEPWLALRWVSAPWRSHHMMRKSWNDSSAQGWGWKVASLPPGDTVGGGDLVMNCAQLVMLFPTHGCPTCGRTGGTCIEQPHSLLAAGDTNVKTVCTHGAWASRVRPDSFTPWAALHSFCSVLLLCWVFRYCHVSSTVWFWMLVSKKGQFH